MNKIVLTLILMFALGGCSGLYHMPWDNVENKNVYNAPVYLPVEKSVVKVNTTVNSATQAKQTVRKAPVVTKPKISNTEVESLSSTKAKQPVITPVAVQEKAINVDYKSKMVIPVE